LPVPLTLMIFWSRLALGASKLAAFVIERG
jgi:hypothetical protein